LVEHIGFVSPTSYGFMKKERYFSDNRARFGKGLLKALENRVMVRETLGALSSFYLDQGDVDRAIDFYRKSMEETVYKNSEGNFIGLGRLFLKKDDPDQSFQYFMQALEKSRDTARSLERIYQAFKGEKQLEAFIRFSAAVEKDLFETETLDYLVAQCWIDMDRPELARARLVQVIARQPTARAHYLMSVAAERQQDWDAMELESQRATVLDSGNAGYLSQFARALSRQKKDDAAEDAVSMAILRAGAPNPWYLNQRAWVRWSRGNFQGAVDDWKAALDSKKDYPDFMVSIARALQKMKQYPEALVWVDRALVLSPGKTAYSDLKKQLQEDIRKEN
ncbi:MAG: tetratricopeptide repeat protein, partial [Pseudomonadota bacterium]